MKLLVFSDTHGKEAPFLQAIHDEIEMGPVNSIFFLGDGYSDINTAEKVFSSIPFYRVAGNCDFSSADPLYGLAPLGGVLFFYTHGHAFGVKNNLDRLYEAASRAGADIALFGHTHYALTDTIGTVTLFNPGALARPNGAPSYGRITIENKVPQFQHILY